MGNHAGDLYIQCSDGNLLSEIYEIHDWYYFNNGSSVGRLEVDSGVSCNSNGTYITITKSTNGEKYVRVPVSLTGDWEFSFEVASWGSVNPATFDLTSPHFWGAYNDTSCIINLADSTQTVYKSISVGSVIRCVYKNGTFTNYINDEVTRSKSATINNAKIGWYTNRDRVQHIKNIKLKPL